MKVRATQDGHYGGYYRLGPYENPDGTLHPGEVFEIDATPFQVKEPETGKPIQEMKQSGEFDSDGRPKMVPVWVLDAKGNPKRDSHGNAIPKIRMATMFAPEWMEPVNDDATVDFPEQKGSFGVLPQMVPGNKKVPANIASRPANLPPDVAAILAGAAPLENPKAESPI